MKERDCCSICELKESHGNTCKYQHLSHCISDKIIPFRYRDFVCDYFIPEIPKVVFRVPNTTEGKEFLRLYKKYINNAKYRTEKYSRGTNRRIINDGSSKYYPRPKISECDYMTVYILSQNEVVKRNKTKRK